MYDKHGNIDNRLKNKLFRLIEYGISCGCLNYIAVIALFFDVVQVDRQRALKLAGESAESGSMIGWKVLTNLLEFNASNQDPFDDGIEVNETDAGVRLHIGIIGKHEDDYDDTNVSKFRQKIIAIMINEEHIGQRQLFFPL